MNKLNYITSKITAIPGVIIYIAYLGLGIYFNYKEAFSAFYFFTSCFTIIFWIANYSIVYFLKYVKKIIALTVKEPPIEKARIVLQKNMNLKINYIIPLGIVLIFSIGGCMLYSSLKVTITFLWCMLLFIPTVYFSICGYMCFVHFLCFVIQISQSSKNYKHLPKLRSFSVPPEINWFAYITKMIVIFQFAFFTVGSLFICAFAVFCQLDAFSVSSNSGIFVLLWGIIIFAIIIAFPIMVIMENKSIDTIHKNIQTSYFLLAKHEDNNNKVENTYKELLYDFITNKIIQNIVIQDSKSYKIYIRKCYAIVTSIFNMIVSVCSLLDILGII